MRQGVLLGVLSRMDGKIKAHPVPSLQLKSKGKTAAKVTFGWHSLIRIRKGRHSVEGVPWEGG